MHTLALSLFHISVGEAYIEINCLFTNVTGPLSDSNWSVVLPTDQVPCMPWVSLGMCLLSPQGCIAPPTHQDSFVRKTLQLPIPRGIKDHGQSLVWRLHVAQLHLILQMGREAIAVTVSSTPKCWLLSSWGGQLLGVCCSLLFEMGEPAKQRGWGLGCL